jgi:hypothetical protein
MSSEQDIDRELQAALSVSPSPDFEARVLRRVEVDRPSHWRAQYGSLAAAASLVMVAGVFYALNRTSPAVATPPPTQVVEHVPRGGVVKAVREPPVSRPEVQTTTTERPKAQTVRVQRIAPRTAEPEVIVPLNQMTAVRRLVREANAGRLIEPPAEPPQGPMAPPAKVSVTPVVVEPIPLSPLGREGSK